MDPAAEAMLLSVGDVNQLLVEWRQEQERLGADMLTEGYARMLRPEVAKGTFSTTLSRLPGEVKGVVSACSSGVVQKEIQRSLP